MSRHRYVKNINIDDELALDDQLSDEDEITPEQSAQLNDAFDKVRAVLGDQPTRTVSDQEIKDALWDWFFDVEKTIDWALDENQKRKAAIERKDNVADKALPSVPQDTNRPPPPVHMLRHDGRRMPLILLAQQQQQLQQQTEEHAPEAYDEPQSPETDEGMSNLDPHPLKRSLTPITERSERTEPSPFWGGAHRLLTAHHNPRMSSTTLTSLGQAIETQNYDETTQPVDPETASLDPNLIPVSPSGSALHRLSTYEPAPSIHDSDVTSSSVTTPRPPPSVDLPPMDTIPDIPDYNSKSTHPNNTGPKQSKLSLLASQRAATSAGSHSSRSSGAEKAGSIKTYPLLRPTSQSLHPPSTSESSKSTSPSSMSSHVRRAVEMAANLENLDQHRRTEIQSISSSQKSPPSTRPTAPTPSKILPEIPSSPVTQSQPAVSPSKTGESTSPVAKPRLSKLAQLAQAKAESNKSNGLLSLGAPAKPPPKDYLPPEHTEILTPIANGPTVTTAITTSYQSLYSLADPSRSSYGPTPFVVPLPVVQNVPISRDKPKQSKLAMKLKNAQAKQHQTHAVTMNEPEVPAHPMFLTKSSRSHAKPSSFGALLVDSNERHRRSKKAKGKQREDPTSSNVRKRAPAESSDDPLPLPHLASTSGFAFDVPSPDDIVFNARKGTALGHRERERGTAKEREKAERQQAQRKPGASSSRSASPVPSKTPKAAVKPAASTPSRSSNVDQRTLDLAALNLTSKEEPVMIEEIPKLSLAKERVLEEAKQALQSKNDSKKGINLVIIGHVDAGKSTLMGHMLYELGRLDEKTKIANERGSSKVGKSSFSWAWSLDGTSEERERGITMDIGQEAFSTPHRHITILDAPGHKDFIPNMISGASQADSALLVVDASTGEFEAGFERGGQTREHLVLVRSLGVPQLIVAVNKLDQVDWSKDRYEEICSLLRPFLLQSGFHPNKTQFVPVGAMLGVNLVDREGEDAQALRQWYSGPTLVDCLDKLEPPSRDIVSPMRFPISNVFKGSTSGTAVSGRLCAGVVQVGERLRVLPGDETAVVKLIEVEETSVAWAAAGSNAVLHLVSIDPIHLAIGTVLCPPSDPVPLATIFTARIIVFDVQVPITSGAAVELFHHSRDVPATVSNLLATLDRTSGTIVKKNPRVLAKGMSAEVQIVLRSASNSSVSVARPIPLEPFGVNKDMGRILLRRGGETIAAGIVLDILG